MRADSPERKRDTGLQLFLGRLLRVGVTLAAAVSASALAMHIATGSRSLPAFSVFRGGPTHERTIRGVLAREPRALMQLGLMILVATPLARVAFSVVGFALERDRLYVALTLAVLALLLLGLFGIA